jgi:hypothetical protein
MVCYLKINYLGEEYDEATSALSLKEFVYMNIFENIAVSSENECKNCFRVIFYISNRILKFK